MSGGGNLSDQIQSDPPQKGAGLQFTVDMSGEKSAVDLFQANFQTMDTSITEFLSGNFIVRGFLQLTGQVPGVGAAAILTDLSISMVAEKLKENRNRKFLQMMSARIDRNEKPETLFANIKKNPEAALDLYTFIQEESQRTQSETKRQRLVNVIRRAAWDDIVWEEAKENARIVASLEDHDVAVLAFSSSVLNCDDGLFDGLPVVTISDSPQNAEKGPKFIHSQFPSLPRYVIWRTCSRLIAEGLFKDEGVGRIGTKAMEYFHITEPGKRFLSWISNH